MKEAIGQTVSLQVILVFMIFLNAFLAFSVNYTKAFRMKNKVINEIEQHEGLDRAAEDAIEDYAERVGYRGNRDPDNTWHWGIRVVPHCIGPIGSEPVSSCASGDVTNYRVYYSVTTSINIDVPIIGPVFRTITGDTSLLRVHGDTSTIYVNGDLDDKSSWGE